MRLLIQHTSRYEYPSPAALGPHRIRLRPADHARAHIESYSLTIPQEHTLHWQRDPSGNHIARVSFAGGQRLDAFETLVQITADIRPVNPFDFRLDDFATDLPFDYPDDLRRALLPYLELDDPAFAMGPRFHDFAPPPSGSTVTWLVDLASRVAHDVRYVIRDEPGVFTPEQTLEAGRGSCRDSAVLLVAAMRHAGLAARFVSGYAVQLRDEGMLPDEPRGVDRDVVDLHAWAEVYLPGAGWIGLDGTAGLLCGEGHIPLACTPSPALASPIEGSADRVACRVFFETRVGRLGHEIRVTHPYTDAAWTGLLAAAHAADERLGQDGITLTTGGEPTFNSRDHLTEPEWLTDALGETKWRLGLRLAHGLRRRLCPGGALLVRQGKHYPGEPVPRWAIDLVWRRPGTEDSEAPLWSAQVGRATDDAETARRFATALAERLGLESALMPAHEDPWHYLQQEALLPVDVDPLAADLTDSDERRRLARLLDRGLGAPVGWVLPLTRAEGTWRGGRWALRRQQLFLLPGDGPIGVRLPLASLPDGWVPPPPPEPAAIQGDPRLGETEPQRALATRWPLGPSATIRTALCVEPRDGALHVFLPPLAAEEDFEALLSEIDRTRRAMDLDVTLEGYPPPAGARLQRFAVTPDPGVLEVNIPPIRSTAEYAGLVDEVFQAALEAGLHAERYLVDGRQQGSGGGNHLTLGGPTLLESPFLVRPDLLASLVAFTQHHPSLSYLFAGLFVGPTSQAPRVDEARHDALYELDLALRRAHATRDDRERPAPWVSDMLFRHLLVDVSGNTHRAEISLDKLMDPASPHGRQGLVELRAFEMPPHPRMMVAQVALVRALVAGFVRTPYQAPLVRFGQALHDRYLLPYFLWRDFTEVLRWLDGAGVPLPEEAYRPFLELRCPVVGRVISEGVTLEVRNALEPWNVLGEEHTPGGTARFVDSSMERVEIRVRGIQAGRHGVMVNGLELPLYEADGPGDHVAGVRFRAWAPPHSLHPHIGIHHPLRIEVVDRQARRSLAAAAYHVWHPEGRAYDTPPLTRFEAGARRAQRFTVEGPSPWPVDPTPTTPHPDAPLCLDLRRFGIDRPMPGPEASGG